jgi:uncharacterized protein (TIGR03118 family)
MQAVALRPNSKESFMPTLSLKATITTLLLTTVLAAGASAQVFRQTNLITDDQSAHPALITDPSLVNAWGISFGPATPFWVSNNGTGTTTLYNVNPITGVPTKLGLTVTIPGNGTLTGQVFNGSSGFNGDRFLFVSLDGTISGWRGALGTTAETLQPGSAGNVYTGSAIATVGGHAYLYAANFGAGTIDVFSPGAPALSGTFKDSTVPAGYAPFNIQMLNGKLYVTYAPQNGSGTGFVDAFDTSGNFLARVGSQGTLDAPWGLAIAPSSFGAFAGDLLVGNFGDGHINVFNLAGDTFLGQLQDETHNPLTIDGLWALTPGNNGGAGSANTLFFSAGPNGETHGLFGTLQSVPEPGSIGLMTALCVTGGIGFLRRRSGK